MMVQGMNAQRGKDHNRALILKLIKRNSSISRKEITELTGLTKGAVTKIVNDLIGAGLVVEKESAGRDGRIKSLCMAELDRYVLSFYLSRSKLSGAIIDFSGVVRYREEMYKGIKPFDNRKLLDYLDRITEALLGSFPGGTDNFIAVGIAVPGALYGKEDSAGSPIAFDWEEIGLADYFRRKFSLPVFIENNSNLAALAESWFGLGKDRENFIEYTIGVGVGSGVIRGKTLLRGGESHICAIGHTTVDYRGEKCFCGNRGCLDMVGGLDKLVKQYREQTGQVLFPSEEEDILRFITELKYILRKGREGDTAALDLIRRQAEILGIGAVTLINLYNPECIVVVEDGLDDVNLDILVDYIREYAEDRTYPTIRKRTRIIHSNQGDDIYLKGAFALVLEHFFEDFSLIG